MGRLEFIAFFVLFIPSFWMLEINFLTSFQLNQALVLVYTNSR